MYNLGPISAHQRNVILMTFNWWVDGSPLSYVLIEKPAEYTVKYFPFSYRKTHTRADFVASNPVFCFFFNQLESESFGCFPSLAITLSKKRTTKALNRLREYACLSVPLMFAFRI